MAESNNNSDLQLTPVEKPVKDYEEDADLNYGCCGFRPTWLQWLNKIGGVVAFLSLANCVMNMANGLIGVILSTLEKRFSFSSSQSSWIASAYEMGPIPVLIVISYFGNRMHRPMSCAIGMLAVTVGSVLFFIPQFTTPLYEPISTGSEEDNQVCLVNGTRTSGCDGQSGNNLSSYLALFIFARLLIGMGSTPILSLGVTFMDDCSTRGKFAVYAGVFNAMSVVGPALAFVGGGLMLNIYVNFYAVDVDDLGFGPTDSRWIGAWWLPYTITAGLALLNAIPIFGYREDLPGAAEIRKNKVTEAHNDEITAQESSGIAYVKSWGEFKKLFKDVLTNPTFLVLTIFTCCDNFIIAGFTAFGPKLFEVGFTLSAATAGAIFGVVLLPAGAGGTIIGGVIIDKMKLSCRQIIRFQTVLTAVVTGTIFLLIISCPPLNFAGVNVPYNNSVGLNLTSACNIGCDCQYVEYNPVCSHDNVVYYSPCHAGCSLMESNENTKNYYNCSCISNPLHGSSQEASSITCTAEFCPLAIVFMVIFFFAVAFIFICLTTNMAATLRCVTSSQTSFAIGVQVLFLKCLGTIIGPIFMGMAFDNSCILWQYDCGTRASCLTYDNEELTMTMFVMCVIIKVISLVAMILANIVYKPPEAIEPIVKEVPAPNDEFMTLTPENVDEKAINYMTVVVEEKPDGYDGPQQQSSTDSTEGEKSNIEYEDIQL